MFWQVGVLVALIWLVDLVIRAKVWPQVRYALWLLVLVKLVLPPTFSLSTSVTSQLPPLMEGLIKQQEGIKEIAPVSYMGENSTAAEPSFDRTVETIVVPRESKSSDAVELSAVTSAGGLTAEAEGERLSWRVYVIGAWLVGAVILAVLLMARFRQLRQAHRGRKGRTDVPDWLSELLVDTAKRLNLRRTPEVALSRKVTSPAVFGVFRPVLLLPEENIAGFSRKDFEHVLLHELAHLKRGDLWAHSVYMVLQIIYWFNPLLWFVRRQLQHLRELCCDATVAGILRERTVDYRETVVETARRLLDRPTKLGMGLLGLFEDSSRLLVRLKWLEKKTWKHRALRIVTIFTVVALMFVCILPMARARHVATASETDEDLTLSQGQQGSVSGTVKFHGTDAPAAGLVVRTISKWFDTVQARTGQQGSYTLAGIRPEAVFHISAEDERKELFMIDMPAVVLKPGEAKTGVDLTLYRGRQGSISGKVVGRRVFYQKPERLGRNVLPEHFERRDDTPLSGVKIVLKSNTGILKETITDQKGRYRFEGLRADDYVVRVEQPAGAVAETVRTLPMAGPGPAEDHGSGQSRWIELRSGPKTDVDFHFRFDWVSIAGRVTDADGKPIKGAKVVAELCSPKMDGGEGRSGVYSTIKISYGSVSAVSDENGRYRLAYLCPVTFTDGTHYLAHGKLYRRYEVCVQAESYSPAKLLVPPITEHLASETSQLMEDHKGLFLRKQDSLFADVALPKSRGNVITDIDFVMEKAAMITGRVLDTQGNIVPGPRQRALVRLIPTDSRDDKDKALLLQMPDKTGLYWVALDEVGRFQIDNVPAGNYLFEVDAKGHRHQRARNETLMVKAGGVIRDIEVIVLSEAVSEGQKVVGTWEMVETNSDNAVAAILILKTDGTYFLEVGTSRKGTTHAKAGTYTVKDGRIQMSGAEWDSVSLEDNRVVIIADSTRTVFEKKDPLKKRTEIKSSCVGAWRVRNQSVVYVIDRSGSVKTYGDYVPEKSKSLITGKYSVVVTADLMEVWQMKEVDGKSSLEISLERIKIDPKVVGSWRTMDVPDELGVDLTGIFLDLRQDATFVLQTKGRDTGKPIKGVYMMTDNDKIQLLSGEKELPIIRFARYDKGTVRLAIGNGAAVLTKQEDRTFNLEQAGKLQVYITLNGKGQMAWSVSARPAGQGPDAEISTQMGKDGRYELTGLKEAEYLVRAPVPLSTGVRGRATVQINNRARVKIEPGKETRLDFELRDNAGIRGAFTCPDRDLSWRILIFDDSAAVRDDSVSEVRQAHALIWKLEQGKHYEIRCLPPGTYRVVGRCCKKDQGWTPVMEKSKTVTLKARETTELDFVFP